MNIDICKRNIPGTNISVHPICLGTMTFGSPVGETEAVELVNYAIDRGINFVDTANMYEGYARIPGSSGGVAEEILGKALKGKRDKVIIATKVGMKVGNLPEDEGTSAAAIRKHLDKSLQRMYTDYVDLYYLHKPDPEADMTEMLVTLKELMDKGKIRHYGISNYNASQLEALLNAADLNKLPRPVICQPALSFLKQEALYGIIPLCVKENIAVVPYQILQGGLLTGKYKRGMPVPGGSRKAEKDGWVWELTDELFDQLEDIEQKAALNKLSVYQYALNWTLAQKGVISIILGVKNKIQIDMAVEAIENNCLTGSW